MKDVFLLLCGKIWTQFRVKVWRRVPLKRSPLRVFCLRLGWIKTTLLDPSNPQTRTAARSDSFLRWWRWRGWEGLITAQENLDKREDNKGVGIESAAFIQPCFLMERHSSSNPQTYGSRRGCRRSSGVLSVFHSSSLSCWLLWIILGGVSGGGV